ncbi:piriformospora indica-insensitive protein 2-like isoform X2 [Triticum dicoccoides]|uniref:piriformospora indica-insensitive protein 2-like isoform X2 n=1 Tax=Triticum dicoccoides TaxID=85692 RepID=UPI00188EC509|nr:piriformospora indica-insensitive protein 2-like isoform X2 [Triticum dicoccoides]
MGRARGGRLLLVLAALFVALLLLSGCAAEGEDEEGSPVAAAEEAALYAAIGGFVGKAWNGSGLFPDPCGQTPIQGVSCDLFNGLWHPTVVSIGPVLDNSLQCAPDARFSPQLFDLRRLKSLTFYACFPAANPTAIPAANWYGLAGTLETLEFRSNPGLAGAIPASLGRLASLQSLVLVDNNLTGAVPPELGGLAKLRRLVLSGNGLSGPVPATLGNNNTQLRRLDEPLLIVDMSKNSLTGSLPPSLGGLKGLLKMDLSNNRLDGRIPPELAGLESLTLLDLRNNSLTGGLPEFVLGMPALQDLLLSSNPLLGGTLMQRGWEKMASLATLDLSNVGLGGAIPESMAAMPRLRFLALDHNRLSGTVPAKLAALPSIGAMYLNGNNLTGALEFSPAFYQRMGSRFASWDNPGLCAAEADGGAPTGVAVCKDAQDPPRVGVRDRMDGGGGKPEASSSLPASSSSFGLSGHKVAGLWCLVMVMVL